MPLPFHFLVPCLVILSGLGIAQQTVAQPAAETSEGHRVPWSTLDFLIGDWIGEEHGRAGDGRGTRTYGPILDGMFLHARNRSEFEPQETNPEGEVHEDWQFFSYDQQLDRIVMRQFHSEGYVHSYVQKPEDEEGDWVFVSDEIENAPAARARLVLRKTGEDSFEEIFYLAFPGGQFREVLRNQWERVP